MGMIYTRVMRHGMNPGESHECALTAEVERVAILKLSGSTFTLITFYKVIIAVQDVNVGKLREYTRTSLAALREFEETLEIMNDIG
jgi:hypothetical protein